MLAQEGDRWTVTLMAHFVEAAPMDLEGLTAFAAALASPDIHDVIRRADPLDEAVTARFPASVRKRYERLLRFPERYVVMGDGLCSFNPIYGQGMSVAALEAVALGDTVAESAQEVGRRFFRRASVIVDTPWTTAVENDLRMPEAEGPRHPIVAVINRYMSHLHRAAHHDPVLARRCMDVANLMAPPSAVFHPRILWRVVRGGVRRRRAACQSPEFTFG